MPPRLIAAHTSVARLRVPSDAPDQAFTGPRSRGSHGQASRRPHSDAKVAAVRRLIEQTTLTYGEIAARTGVGRASICRWTKDGQWQRPPFAPRATDTVPRARASAKLRARTLAARLFALADRYVRDLEETPGIKPAKLREALELLKMARLAAQGRRRKRRIADPTPEEAKRDTLSDLARAGIDPARAPRDAVADFIECRQPPPRNDYAFRQRGSKSRSRKHYAWMQEKDPD